MISPACFISKGSGTFLSVLINIVFIDLTETFRGYAVNIKILKADLLFLKFLEFNTGIITVKEIRMIIKSDIFGHC